MVFIKGKEAHSSNKCAGIVVPRSLPQQEISKQIIVNVSLMRS